VPANESMTSEWCRCNGKLAAMIWSIDASGPTSVLGKLAGRQMPTMMAANCVNEFQFTLNGLLCHEYKLHTGRRNGTVGNHI
jgi:hypothetical protein